MQRCGLTAVLLAGALVADGQGTSALALYLVLAAIPAAAWAALAHFGELVDGTAAEDTGALDVGLSTLVLALAVLAAGVRTHAVEGAAVPALGSSAVVGAVALIAVQFAVWVAVRAPRERIAAAIRSRA